MTDKFYTFDDLQFEPHPTAVALKNLLSAKEMENPYNQELCNAAWARMDFPNRYGVSVICGIQFYSNGRDSYEIAVMYEGNLTMYFPEDSVRGWQTKEQITEIMKEVQERKD